MPPRLQKKTPLEPATKPAGQSPKSPIRPAKPHVKKKPEVEEVKYVAICKFFNRGACAYGDKCNKAHEKLPLYKKDLTTEMIMKKVVTVVEEKGDTDAKCKSDSQSSGKTSILIYGFVQRFCGMRKDLTLAVNIGYIL